MAIIPQNRTVIPLQLRPRNGNGAVFERATEVAKVLKVGVLTQHDVQAAATYM
jgi:hypothetical protein